MSRVREDRRSPVHSEVFDIDGKAVRVENIPATVCTQCGESVFSRETTEKVRRMVHGEAKPVNAFRWMCLLSAKFRADKVTTLA